MDFSDLSPESLSSDNEIMLTEGNVDDLITAQEAAQQLGLNKAALQQLRSNTPTTLEARLIVEADNQEFDLSGRDNVLIGREDAVANIWLYVDLTPHGGEEGGVACIHARIIVENGQYMLEDENSANFTFLNHHRLAPKTPTPLHHNDEIKLGRVLLHFLKG